MNTTSTRRSLMQLAALFLTFAVVFTVGQWLVPSAEDGRQDRLVVNLWKGRNGDAMSAAANGARTEFDLHPTLTEDRSSVCVVVPDPFEVTDQEWTQADDGSDQVCRPIEPDEPVTLELEQR